MIAKKLTGMTPREAEKILLQSKWDCPRGFTQRDLIEEEMGKAEREKDETEAS